MARKKEKGKRERKGSASASAAAAANFKESSFDRTLLHTSRYHSLILYLQIGPFLAFLPRSRRNQLIAHLRSSFLPGRRWTA
jgi:hypothetical protein